MTDSETLIQASRLVRRFGDFTAVDGIDFAVARGEVLGFLGPNGAGKSTTMQMLAGALTPSAGAIHVDGIDLLAEPVRARRQVGFAPEQPPVYRDLSVNQYLRFTARLRGLTAGQAAAAVARARARTGLAEVGGRLIGNLSKGFQQRVGIAQAIIHEPAIVILDEPTSGLDPNQIRGIRALIRELGSAHSVIVSTHILAEVQSLCDRVVILADGRIVLDEPLAGMHTGGAGDAHRLALREPCPPPAPWLEVDGVTGAERLADGGWRVSHDGRQPTLDALLERARPYGVVEFARERHTLEERFVALTAGDAGAAAAD